MMTTSGTYAFDNDNVHANDQHALLGQILDPITRDRAERLGIRPGWRCLEVGAGAGSVAAWLADRVGDEGHVLATDINPRHLEALGSRANVTAVRHDITTDDLPAGAFDLVHARLVLMHLPQRQDILERLRAALVPGGIILLDEFDCTYGPVLDSPDGSDPGVNETYNRALNALLTSAGADPAFGRHAYRALREAGFRERAAEVTLREWSGGTAWCALQHSNSFHLQPGLEANGITTAELETFRTLMRDPAVTVAGYPVYSTSARR